MKIDMHIHTTASDGTWSPEALIEKLLEAKIQIFSVTDHDSIENVSPTAVLVKDAGLHFIPGVEINTSHEKNIFHILGYGINVQDESLRKVLSKNKRFAQEKNEESIIYLAEKGLPVSLDEYLAYVNQPERGGWKSLNYFIDKRLCTSHKDFFRLFKGIDNPFNTVNLVSIDEAISAIKKAGGIPVIAHPGARVYSSDYKTVIDIMLKHGIEGIECYHPENSPEVSHYCRIISEKHGLYISGGSDCHGDFVKERILGKPEIELDDLEIGGLL